MSLDMLLHPELMSNEQLITIIQQRHLKVSNIHGMPRDDLLNLFHKYCVPYGQRSYKETGRGKILNKNRNASPEPKSKMNTIHSTTVTHDVKNTKTRSINQNERLKPPPDILSGHMKRIKLESKSVNNEPDKFKRKVPVDLITQSIDCPPAKKERKPITWP